MKNLEIENIIRDDGIISLEVIKELEKFQGVTFPPIYVDFISKHNGARITARIFDYEDSNREDGKNSDAIAFMKVEEISETIEDLLNQSTDDSNDPDIWKIYKYFDKKLVPFGDTGGGDMICFDYRKHDGDNPPIVLWSHDASDSAKRISFIANNFEEFINMLHKPED